MLEEFYYVNATEPTAHFRHGRRANGIFFDGHAGGEEMLEGSLDRRLPQHRVGRLPPELLLLDSP
jgi:prepilin-type processing-associated H-X9-DG protein